MKIEKAYQFVILKLAKLLDVKSIVTLLMVIVLCVCVLKQVDVPEVFSLSLGTVLGFFFSKPQKANTEQSEGVEKNE